MASQEHVFGIDLGTTYTSVGCVPIESEGYNSIGCFKFQHDDVAVNTVVLLRSMPGREAPCVWVGKRARERYLKFLRESPDDSGTFVEFAKRETGVGEDEKLSRAKDRWFVQDREYVAQEVHGIFLRALARQIEAQRDIGGMRRVVITHPQYFNEVQKKATRQAAELAGLEVMGTINEPDAAALTYDVGPGLHVIFDFGGGTLDVVVLKVDDRKNRASIASSGDPYMGGGDFDEAMLNYFLELVRRDYPEFRYEDEPAYNQRVWIDFARETKEALSKVPSTQIAVPVSTLPAVETCPITIRNQDFWSLPVVNGFLGKIREKTLEALNRAGAKPEQIDRVVLVGGSTRIPKVRDLLREIFGKDPDDGLNPITTVAYGAALYARTLARAGSGGKRAQLELSDDHSAGHISKGLGILVFDRDRQREVVKLIIRPNSKTPLVQEQSFKTREAGRARLEIDVYETNPGWDRADADLLDPTDCPFVGTIEFDAPRPLDAQTPLKVAISVDMGGTVSVILNSPELGASKSARLRGPGVVDEIEQNLGERRSHIASLCYDPG
jgi:molecular chaperone DnaK